jgi:hypothetical protein
MRHNICPALWHQPCTSLSSIPPEPAADTTGSETNADSFSFALNLIPMPHRIPVVHRRNRASSAMWKTDSLQRYSGERLVVPGADLLGAAFAGGW